MNLEHLNYDTRRHYVRARYSDGAECGWATHVPRCCTAHTRQPCEHTEHLAATVPAGLRPEEVTP